MCSYNLSLHKLHISRRAPTCAGKRRDIISFFFSGVFMKVQGRVVCANFLFLFLILAYIKVSLFICFCFFFFFSSLTSLLLLARRSCMSLSFLWDFFSILYGIVLIVHIYIEIVRNTISVLSRQLSRALCLFLFFVLHGPSTTLLTIFTVRHRSPTMLLLHGKKNELLFADVVLYYYYHCCYLWTVLVRCDRIVECFFFS